MSQQTSDGAGSPRPHPDRRADRTDFEQRWRDRFIEFANLREDDAGIAGWSSTGLETRFRFFRQLWRPAPPDVLYLDVGCGAATYTRWVATQGVRIVGLDYSQPTLVKARARTSAEIPLCAGDAKQLPFPSSTFDGALCFGVLQALSESHTALHELARVLKPGGVLWIDALNAAGLGARAAQARLRLQGKRMHLRYEHRRAVAGALHRAGFIDLEPYWLPIAPSRLQRLQPMLEHRPATTLISHFPLFGMLVSHSFIFRARRGSATTA